MTLFIPVGIPGSGKSTLGREFFRATEIVNPDAIRASLTDSEASQDCNGAVFTIAHQITNIRIDRGLDVFFDATNLSIRNWPKPSANGDMVVIVMDTPVDQCIEQNKNRERVVPRHAMERLIGQFDVLKKQLEQFENVIPSSQFIR